jgi:hypothetical protein
MSLKLNSSGGGSVTLQEPSTASNLTLTLPTTTGTAVIQNGSNNLLMNSGYGSDAVAYGCRAWVKFNGTGTVTINGSGNVSSITDNGTGNYTINFTTAMPDDTYSVAGWACDNNSGGNQTIVSAFANHTYSASACQIYCYETSATIDPTRVCATFFR